MKKTGVWPWIVAVLAILIGLSSYRYLVTGMAGAPANIVANRYAATGALVFHAGVSATVLILGALQFFPRLRARWPKWHRRAGTVYVIGCLLGGVAGLVLAAGTSSGPIAVAGFGLLAIIWIYATAQAWRFAKARDFVRHQRWMTRSYALTFAAVTLRLYVPISIVAHLDLNTAYIAISWLAWVPNLIVAEIWLRRGVPLRTSPRPAAAAQSPG